MPSPRVLATALWLAVTVASTAMVWTATSIVAGDVTDRPASVLAPGDVVSELASGPPVPGPAPTSIPPPSSSTSTTPPRGRGPAPGSDGPAPAATADPTPQPGPAVAPTPPATPTTTAPTPPSTPPTTQPLARPTATYSTAGGVVRVVCNGFFIELVSAIPTNGYAVDVVAGGPANVEVHFRRGGQDLPVRVVCFNQPIRY